MSRSRGEDKKRDGQAKTPYPSAVSGLSVFVWRLSSRYPQVPSIVICGLHHECAFKVANLDSGWQESPHAHVKEPLMRYCDLQGGPVVLGVHFHQPAPNTTYFRTGVAQHCRAAALLRTTEPRLAITALDGLCRKSCRSVRGVRDPKFGSP